MPGIARIGDIAVGTCCCHSDPKCVPWVGVIASGASTVRVNGKPAAGVGDIVVGCHPGVIASGKGNVLSRGKATAKIGSIVVGCATGVVISGSGNVLV